MTITELHTVATNLKGNFVKKLNIYSARASQLICNNLEEYIEGPPIPRRNQGIIDSEFHFHILQPFDLNERVFRVDQNLLQNGKKKMINCILKFNILIFNLFN